MAHKETLIPASEETVTSADIALYTTWVHQQLGEEVIPHTERKSLKSVFGRERGIVIAGIKLPPSPQFPGYLGHEATVTHLQQNLHALHAAGVHGVVLDTTFDRPHPLIYRNTETLDYYRQLTQAAKFHAKDMKIGINMLLFDTLAALSVAKVSGLDYVIADVYTDRVLCSKEESYRSEDVLFRPQPAAVDAFRQAIGAEQVLILAGIDSKFFPKISPGSVQDSAHLAKLHGADAGIVGHYTDLHADSLAECSLPLIAMGGVKVEDLQHIQNNGYAGYSAGSLFEVSPGHIDGDKTRTVMNIHEGIYGK